MALMQTNFDLLVTLFGMLGVLMSLPAIVVAAYLPRNNLHHIGPHVVIHGRPAPDFWSAMTAVLSVCFGAFAIVCLFFALKIIFDASAAMALTALLAAAAIGVGIWLADCKWREISWIQQGVIVPLAQQANLHRDIDRLRTRNDKAGAAETDAAEPAPQ